MSSLFCGIGERCREGELYRDMKACGRTTQHGDGLRADDFEPFPAPAFGCGQARRSPWRNTFRDGEHRDVLLQHHRQHLPIHPSRLGSVRPEHGPNALAPGLPAHDGPPRLSALEERIANTFEERCHHLHSRRYTYPLMTSPIRRRCIPSRICLRPSCSSRQRASAGLFPAIDPLQSASKMATPGIVGERHYLLSQEIRRTLAQYAELKDIIAMLGLEQLSPQADRECRNQGARATTGAISDTALFRHSHSSAACRERASA